MPEPLSRVGDFPHRVIWSWFVRKERSNGPENHRKMDRRIHRVFTTGPDKDYHNSTPTSRRIPFPGSLSPPDSSHPRPTRRLRGVSVPTPRPLSSGGDTLSPVVEVPLSIGVGSLTREFPCHDLDLVTTDLDPHSHHPRHRGVSSGTRKGGDNMNPPSVLVPWDLPTRTSETLEGSLVHRNDLYFHRFPTGPQVEPRWEESRYWN